MESKDSHIFRITAEKGKTPPASGKFVDMPQDDGTRKIFFAPYDPSKHVVHHWELIAPNSETAAKMKTQNAGLVSKFEEGVYIIFGNSGFLNGLDGKPFVDLSDERKLELDKQTVAKLNEIYAGEIRFISADEVKKRK